jgi:hypothetical protein
MNPNKVGIISINRHTLDMNFGAALHSFAFQKYLDKTYAVDNVIIDYKYKIIIDYRLDFPLLTAIKKRMRMRTVIGFFLRLVWYKVRYDKFELFYKNNCRTIDCYGKPFTGNDFEKNEHIENFDFGKIVCESDVIWSPKSTGGFDRAFFCDYAFSKNMIKIAYAASISNHSFTDEEENTFKHLINNFDYISTREKQTADYVGKLTDKSVFHVLDPTLLLNAEDYYPVMKKRRNQTNYLLLYSAMSNDLTMLKKAKNLAKLMNLDFIEISNNLKNKIYHKVCTYIGVEEFLWYFSNARFIVTNAFHGMCFSIIFKKDFYVFPRDGTDLKLRSLVSTLDLEENFITHNKELLPITIDYDKTYVKLNEERKKSTDFINYAIINSTR